MNYSPGVLHAFNPKLLFSHKPHPEVRFVYGRYLDIATHKGKDIHSLYFGTSKNSDLLAGIFLGDLELTSRVKDVSMVSNGKNIILTVKYIGNDGKLTTLKGKVPTSSYIESISGLSEDLLDKVKVIDASVRLLENKVTKLTNTVNNTVTKLDDLIDDLNNGKYSYVIKESEGPYKDGQPRLYTLYKGGEVDPDSSVIKMYEYVLKELKYDDENNKLIARSWPKVIDETTKTWVDDDGNTVTATLNPEYIQTTDVNLDLMEQHFAEYINTDSAINDRLTIIETSLSWEDLFTDGD